MGQGPRGYLGPRRSRDRGCELHRFPPNHPRGHLSPSVDPQLLSDVLEVAVRRSFGDEKLGGDLAVGQALRDHARHFELAGAQMGRRLFRGWSGQLTAYSTPKKGYPHGYLKGSFARYRPEMSPPSFVEPGSDRLEISLNKEGKTKWRPEKASAPSRPVRSRWPWLCWPC